MAVTYAMGVRTAWLKGVQPEPSKLPEISLKMLLANVTLDLATLAAANSISLRPFAVGGASASNPDPAGSGPKPDTTIVEDPSKQQDYWLETPTQWIRVHIVPRHQMCYPPDINPDKGDLGPVLDTLGVLRVTHFVLANSTRDTKSHDWRDPHQMKTKIRMKWTGRFIFIKLCDTLASDGAVVELSGMPIAPGTILAVRASLSTVRSQLAAAQRQDPRLDQIIRHLRGERAGSYVAEPRGPDSRKVQARSLKYRLTIDNVLVARLEGDELSEDLPVVPDSPHSCDVPGAPQHISWKHSLPGAVHDTVTGEHRSAKEMANELRLLVSWWPPEALLTNCGEWRERCKLCTSVHKRPRHEPAFKAVTSQKLFYRIQIDLCEVKPSGSLGERYIFTCICVATRYIFLRSVATREADVLPCYS